MFAFVLFFKFTRNCRLPSSDSEEEVDRIYGMLRTVGVGLYVIKPGSKTKPVTDIASHTCLHCNYILSGFNILSDL